MGGGVSFRIAPITLAGVSPVNGRVPGHHLVDDRAERPDVAARVGLLALHLLRRHVLHGAQNRPLRRARPTSPAASSPTARSAPPAPCSFARPKSSSFAPAFVSMMLAGLMSRWTMPARCARSSAAAISVATPQRLIERQRALLEARRQRLALQMLQHQEVEALPSAAMCRPMSCSVQMCGWFSAATARASRSKRSRACGSAATPPAAP